MSDTHLIRREETVPPTSHNLAVAGSAADRLLRLLCATPVDQGPNAALRHLVDGVAAIVPSVSFAVAPCHLASADDIVSSCASSPSWAPPAMLRVFPSLAHERVLPLCDDRIRCLHCGSDDPAVDDDDGPLVALLRSCADAISFGLRAADGADTPGQTGTSSDRLRPAMIQTEKMASLGEIAAGVVHELGNPLTAIATYSNYLLRKGERSGLQDDDLERIRRISEASDRILKFTRALVSYARPAEDPPAPVSLHDVVDRSLVFCEHVIHESRVHVVADVPADLPAVNGVSGQLIQVFVNLVTNACQAMSSSGGTLHIEARAAETQHVNVTVRDTGPGIDDSHLPHIFEPFFTTKDRSKGSGLGLSIVRFIVAGHSGDVHAVSPGDGAVFTVRLPAIPSPPPGSIPPCPTL